jgi:hypothetical protein
MLTFKTLSSEFKLLKLLFQKVGLAFKAAVHQIIPATQFSVPTADI